MAANVLRAVPKGDPISVDNDGKLAISEGKSRFVKEKWKNREILWSDFLQRISFSWPTPETHAEFMKYSSDKQTEIKDVGGFVGGYLKGGNRQKGTVELRQMITLDADFAPADLWGEMMGNLDLDFAMAIYSSHKHCEKEPRLRICIPLSRTVTPDEYAAVSRKLAEKIGMDYFDGTTFQPERLMFWPSHSSDVEPVFKYYDSEWLDPDDILAEYPDWTDMSYWPMHRSESELRKNDIERAGDPFEKPGVIGGFNNAYPIREAIETFLSDIYVECAIPGRYTYAKGTTAAGVILYEDEGFAFSHHSTDPAGGLHNAFDLVRIHKFGYLDEGVDPAKGITKMPSYKEMVEFALKDPKVSSYLSDKQAQKAADDFKDLDTDEDWRNRLERDKKGDIRPTASNAKLILTYDEHLRGIRFNELTQIAEAPVGSLPWKHESKYWMNSDSNQLYIWVATEHGVQFPNEIFMKALDVVTHDRAFHPIKEYLDRIPEWDGIERIDTLLVDYFDAEDSVYTREATRKWLTAAIARIYQPGIKFDYMLVLNGPQGAGKSTFFHKLAGEWFSDNLTMMDMKDKTGMERLQGYWIMEIGEMAGMRKADIECVKGFVSKQEDVYRPAYGRTQERHPRQCVLAGSTNSETGFLRDVTGNRRFWPVKISKRHKKNIWKITQEEIDQVWAEAKSFYEMGEPLMLSADAEAAALQAQREAMEEDPRQAKVEEYLDRLLPENWEDLDTDTRIMYLNGDSIAEGVKKRDTISIIEIWTECFGKRDMDITVRDREEIRCLMIRIANWSDTAEKRIRLKAYKNIQVRAYVRLW